MSNTGINTKTELVKEKTGVWHYSSILLKNGGIKNTGRNQYILMLWLKEKNKQIIQNDYIIKNSNIEIPASKNDLLKIICVQLKINQTSTEYYNLMECSHEKDGAIEVAKYIVDEIKTNIKSKEASEIYDYLDYKIYIEKYYNKNTLAPPPDPIVIKEIGVAKWIAMVDTGKPWDHKPKIYDRFKHCAVKERPFKRKGETYGVTSSQYHKYQYHDYFLDVWSNIHYGFVGRYCGFSEDFLNFGSDAQQFLSNLKRFDFSGDDPADKITIQLGMDLYTKYKDRVNELDYQIILDELEKLSTVGESRLLHKCFDTSKNGVTFI